MKPLVKVRHWTERRILVFRGFVIMRQGGVSATPYQFPRVLFSGQPLLERPEDTHHVSRALPAAAGVYMKNADGVKSTTDRTTACRGVEGNSTLLALYILRRLYFLLILK